MFSVTLSVALQPPVFHWYPLLRSPDFPLPSFLVNESSGCLFSQLELNLCRGAAAAASAAVFLHFAHMLLPVVDARAVFAKDELFPFAHQVFVLRGHKDVTA